MVRFHDRVDRLGPVSILTSCVTVSSLCYFINLPLVPLILQERDPSRLSAVGVLVSAAFIVAAVMSPV